MSRDSWSRGYTRHIWIHFLICKIVCRITLKVSPNCLNLLCFGSFAGVGAHHQGLTRARLKPCQFLALWMWQTLFSAPFELLTVCCSWTTGRKANEPCLSRFQSTFVEVSSKVKSVWTTVCARFKPGQRQAYRKIANCLAVDFPTQRYAKFSRLQRGQILAAWLTLLIKRELLELVFPIFPPNFLFKMEAEEVFCQEPITLVL